MSKKKLNTSGILNELSGQSVFFQKEKSPTLKMHDSSKQSERTEMRSEQRTDIRSEDRSEKRTVQLPIKRRTKRYSFEFYEDQISDIKKIKIETELDGESISMSEVVRNALDQYFETVRKSERTEDRTEQRTEKNPT